MRSSILNSINPMMTIFLPHLKSLKVDVENAEQPQILQYIHAPNIQTLCLSDYNAPLEIFFEHSPRLQALYVGKVSLPHLIAALHSCASLKKLHIIHTGTEMSNNHEVFLKVFVDEDKTAKICPQLEYFVCSQTLDISLDTARAFIDGTDTEIPNLPRWKVIAMEALEERTDRYIAEKIAERGLNEGDVDEWN